MANFVLDGTELYSDKLKGVTSPFEAHEPEKVFTFQNANDLKQAANDLRDHTSGTINIKSFGAVGVGGDDTTIIQAAVAAASVGTLLIIPFGTYRVSTVTISGKTDLSISGGGTIIPLNASVTTLFDVDNSPGLDVRGLTFDGLAGPLRTAIDLQTSPRTKIIGNHFYRIGDGTLDNVRAILVEHGSHGTLIHSNHFEALTSLGVTRGIFITNFRDTSSFSHDVSIVGNSFDDIGPMPEGVVYKDADAIVFDQPSHHSNAVVMGNTFRQIGKRAVKVITNGVNVVGNEVLRDTLGQSFSAFSGYGNDIRFEANEIHSTGGSDYFAGFDILGSRVKIINNTLVNDATSPSISIYGVVLAKATVAPPLLNAGATTGTITIATRTLVVNSATGLAVGSFINIAGVTGVKRITGVSGTTITIDADASASVVNASITYAVPILNTEIAGNYFCHTRSAVNMASATDAAYDLRISGNSFADNFGSNTLELQGDVVNARIIGNTSAGSPNSGIKAQPGKRFEQVIIIGNNIQSAFGFNWDTSLATNIVVMEGNLNGTAAMTHLLPPEVVPSINIYPDSEPLLAAMSVTAGVVQAAGLSAIGLTNGVVIPAVNADKFASETIVNANVTTGVEYVISAYVKMTDLSVPVLSGSSSSGDFSFFAASVYINVDRGTRFTVTPTGVDNIYRCSVHWVAPASRAGELYGISRFQTQSDKEITITGFQMEIAELGAYIHTSGGPSVRSVP